MRGSDPDAAVFYLARALYAGEDPEFLARRIMICASEDVGMANPNALLVATAAAEAVRMVGMPEARIILAHAAIMVAASPKSNACYMAIDKALEDVENIGYKYAHDYVGNIVYDMEYLPPEMKGTRYYNPTSNGYELRIREWLEKRRTKQVDIKKKRED